MYRLTTEKEAHVLNALLEGNSIRSTERLTGVYRNTVTPVLCRGAAVCRDLMDELLRDPSCTTIQVDEVWCCVRKKQGPLTKGKRLDHPTWGDTHVFAALDADTKLTPVWRVGERTLETATEFVLGLEERPTSAMQLTTDAISWYPEADERALGCEIGYAIMSQTYATRSAGRGRHSPPRIARTDVKVVCGNPDPAEYSFSFVERSNLTCRAELRRLTRLTSAFSRKLGHLKAAVALRFLAHNFASGHGSLEELTPAMAAGVTNRLWRMEYVAAHAWN